MWALFQFLIHIAKLISMMLMPIYIPNSQVCKCTSLYVPLSTLKSIFTFARLIGGNDCSFPSAFLYYKSRTFNVMSH